MPLWRPGGYNGQDRLFGQSEIFSWTQLFVQLQDMHNRKKEPTFQLNISCSVLLAYILGGGRPWQESRSQEILEKKWLIVSPLMPEKWSFISRSPLDFQDFEDRFLFLLSICEISKLRVSFSSRFSRLFSFFSYQYTKSLGALPSPTFRWQTFGLSIYEILFPVPHLVKDYLFGGLRCH